MTKCLKFFLFALLLFLCSNVFATQMTGSNIEADICLAPAEFAMQSDWINADSYIGFCEEPEIKHEDIDPAQETSSEQSFFSIFDYIPNTNNTLIDSASLKDVISIKSEGAVDISVKYNDQYNVPITSGYPKLYYKKQDTSDDVTEVTLSSVGGNTFSTSLTMDYGAYEYYVKATNAHYPGEYSTIANKKIFVVTERPHNFQNLNPNLQDNNATSNAIVNFNWSVEKGVSTDILKHTLYLGTSESSMQSYDADTVSSYTVKNLLSRARYYWKVEVENQYGAKLISPTIYQFVTLGEIKKAYNAPNPFNPQKGQKTRIFFEMAEDGKADIDVYSEYGDKIFHTTCDNLSAGNNEYSYNGRDDYGKILYNGTYLCVIKKKYSGHTSTERCRLLIIK